MNDGRSAHHTPLDNSGATIVRMIVAPVSFIRNIGGQLSDLLLEESWYQPEGHISVDETIKEIFNMIDLYHTPFFVGAIQAFLTDNAPIGWLEMTGQTVLVADYPELADAMPSQFNDGTNLTIPDMTGLTLFGKSAGLGDIGGQGEITIQETNLPEHEHGYDRPVANIDIESAGAPDILALGLPFDHPDTVTTGWTTPPTPIDITPPHIQVNFYIFSGRYYE